MRSLPRTGALWVPAALAAVAGSAALGLAGPSAGPVSAAAAPGQPLVNDYGQSAAEVATEVAAAVNADPAVVRARARAVSLRTTQSTRIVAESRARTAYLAAVKSRVKIRITRTRAAYLAAHASTLRAKAAYAAAAKAYATTRASVTARVRGTHYLPVDGTFTGTLKRYLVPTTPISFEPMQVQVTVYGGHVSDVVVTDQAAPGSDSASYNDMALSTLVLRAMNAGDTSAIAGVSGATLSSGAFTSSLQSALVAAGFKG